MFQNVTLNGADGSLRWGYHHAAALGAYTVTKIDALSWSLTATVLSSDAFRVSRRPLVFVAPHEKGSWKWPIVSLQIEGAQLSAVLGPMEKK